MKLTTRSNKSKTYYSGKYGLLQTCSFLSDITVPLEFGDRLNVVVHVVAFIVVAVVVHVDVVVVIVVVDPRNLSLPFDQKLVNLFLLLLLLFLLVV